MEPGVFFFKGLPDCQFLIDMPSSHKGWKHFFFFVQLKPSLPFGCSWQTEIPGLPDLKQIWSFCKFSFILLLLQRHRYSISALLQEPILSYFKSSSFPFSKVESIGSMRGVVKLNYHFIWGLTIVFAHVDEMMRAAVFEFLAKRKRGKSRDVEQSSSTRKRVARPTTSEPPPSFHREPFFIDPSCAWASRSDHHLFSFVINSSWATYWPHSSNWRAWATSNSYRY